MAREAAACGHRDAGGGADLTRKNIFNEIKVDRKPEASLDGDVMKMHFKNAFCVLDL